MYKNIYLHLCTSVYNVHIIAFNAWNLKSHPRNVQCVHVTIMKYKSTCIAFLEKSSEHE